MSLREHKIAGMEPPVGRLASVSLDCSDAETLAAFYAALLGLPEATARPDRSLIVLADGSLALTLVQVADHSPPDWPDGPQRQQVHLDIWVPALDPAVDAAVALGANLARTQPRPAVWRVLLDPAGHPFCLTTHAFCLTRADRLPCSR